MSKKVISTLMSSAQAIIGGANSKISGVQLPSLSRESLDDTQKEQVSATVQAVVRGLDETVKSEFGMGVESFTKLNAEKIVEYSMRMVQSAESYKDDLVKEFKKGGDFITGPAGQASDGLVSFGNESFDGAATNNALYFTLTYNLMASRQDAFTEALYPIIMVDPTKSGVTVEADITNLYSEFARSTTGGTDGNKFNRINIVKALNDDSLLSEEKNRIYPVKTADNASAFVDYYTFTAVSSGETVTSAPIKANTPVSLLGLSQTEAMLAKGTGDSTDSLDRNLVVDQIFFSVFGNDGTSDVTETFSANVGLYSSANFTYTPQDHNRDLLLSFPYADVVIIAGTTTQTDGSASDLFAAAAGVPVGTKVKLRFRLTGSSNTQTSDTEVSCSGIELVGVWDTNNNALGAGDAAYDAVATFVGSTSTKFDGYVLKAYRTNLNMRTYGHLLTNDVYTQGYAVPILSGIAAKAGNINAFGPEDDATKIMAKNINLTGAWMNMSGARALTSYAAQLKAAVEHGLTGNTRLMGVGSYYVDPYYAEDSMDVSTAINSISSKDRQDDIRSVILSKIKDMAVRMITGSKYQNALGVLGTPGSEPTVIIATDVLTGSYIGNSGEPFDLAPGIKARIVTTNNTLVRGKIFVTLGVFDGNENTAVNPLHFGNCLFSPTVSAIVTRSDNGGTFKALATYPRYAHINNLPVLSVITVSGLDNAVGSIAVPFHSV